MIFLQLIVLSIRSSFVLKNIVFRSESSEALMSENNKPTFNKKSYDTGINTSLEGGDKDESSDLLQNTPLKELQDYLTQQIPKQNKYPH